ncbi:MAG: hypothetical protein COW67_04075 [Flavobacteriales bacterium CG18_big_fil_WC_8_21_14_2_50_32_9]|nr:MAG: hypothetical protein COW67_04075 [Flavobacteriales bacterium CG18_big_fil_WC_8_21_14_2_50_32_9]PJC61465.1 MAG: hypothetical protein CO022_09710 [Flavobacteriales bacterium CG_4_9_14_0_2_um_filter_32_27]
MDTINKNTEVIIPIEKEIIGSLKFPKENMLKNENEQKELQHRLDRAMHLGNNKIKVKIFFQDIEGKKVVETSIWGVTESNVILKGTTIIPIRAIHEIKFF